MSTQMIGTKSKYLKTGVVFVVVACIAGIVAYDIWGRDEISHDTFNQNVQNRQKDVAVNVILADFVKDTSKSLKKTRCTFADKNNGNGAVTTFIVDGEKFKITTDFKDVRSFMVFDGSTQYTWLDHDKQGLKIAKSCLDEVEKLNGDDAKEVANQPVEDALSPFESGQSARCVPITESDFSVPTDINFSDQCDIFRKFNGPTSGNNEDGKKDFDQTLLPPNIPPLNR